MLQHCKPMLLHKQNVPTNAEADATAKANTIAERDNTIAQLNAQIENLKNGAGSDDNGINKDNDGTSKSPIADEVKIYNSANELYKLLQ